MAYCTKEQVSDEFNGSVEFSTVSNPTATTVDRWIQEADSVIDAKIGLRYETPVVAANDLIIIRQISIYLVSARVRRRLNRTGPEGETAKVKVADTEAKAMKMLDEIAKGMLLLSEDTALKSSDGGIASYTQGLECPHTFKKNEDQW